MNRLKIIFIIFIFFTIGSFAQEKLKFELFPSGLNFMPLKANHQEPRIGVLYYTETSNLKVDIGNSVDLLSFSLPEEKIKINMAIEFMAYAYSTSFAGYRLQIDAVDGFFGGDVTFSKKYNSNRLLSRFRIIHNSAHFVDGHYNLSKDEWMGDYKPIPYTKDFGELTLAHEVNIDFSLLRYYGGMSYASLVRPGILKRWNFHLGFEFALKNLFGKILNNNENIFIANHFSLNGEDKYTGSQQTMLGIKIGSWNKKGVVFYLSYYTGKELFSSYLGKKVSKFGIGFFVDYF